MEIVFILLVAGAMNITCFMIGAKVGQTVSKGEEITIPNPIEAVNEYRVKKEAYEAAAKEQKRIDAILRNIDNYNGTAEGQEEV
jgi:hypothetical protein